MPRRNTVQYGTLAACFPPHTALTGALQEKLVEGGNKYLFGIDEHFSYIKSAHILAGELTEAQGGEHEEHTICKKIQWSVTDQWCQAECLLTPPNCPEHLCKCTTK